jgi:hypothetical protein
MIYMIYGSLSPLAFSWGPMISENKDENWKVFRNHTHGVDKTGWQSTEGYVQGSRLSAVGVQATNEMVI